MVSRQRLTQFVGRTAGRVIVVGPDTNGIEDSPCELW
jgi:hypothetical protein